MFHQPRHQFCSTNIHVIPLGAYELSVSYVEELDENTVDFPHEHPKEYEIYYAIKNPLFCVIGNKLVHIPEGEFLFINKGIFHSIIHDPDMPPKYLSIIFSLNRSPSVSSAISSIDAEYMDTFFRYIEKQNHIVCKDNNDSFVYIQKMRQEFEKKDWGWTYQLNFLYAAYIFSILKNFVHPIATFANTDSGDPNLPIELTKYLHENYPNPDLSLQDMADNYYMSARHIQRLFKDYWGQSPSRTLTRYRINYVKKYIEETDYSVDTIAEKVGLSSASTLSRLFKELEGITISEYRQNCKQQKKQNAERK